MRVITVKLQEELLQQLDLIAINRRVNRSEIIREALLEYIKTHKLQS